MCGARLLCLVSNKAVEGSHNPVQGQAPDSDLLSLHFLQALALARRLRALAAAEAAACGLKACLGFEFTNGRTSEPLNCLCHCSSSGGS